MFTGLIEAVGSVIEVTGSPSGLRARVQADIAGDLRDGDSLSVNGVCLTVVDNVDGVVAFDVSPETARVTTLGALAAGALVNLERSLRADARMGGHFVQGHVDATGTVTAVKPEGESYRLSIAFPPQLQPLIVHKGSIAVDGVSLTVASIDDERGEFDVQIIPFTWLHTCLRSRQRGNPVNLECDILGKYVVRALGLRGEWAPIHRSTEEIS